MRHVPLTIAASLLFALPAAARVRADPPAAAPAATPAATPPPMRVVNISVRIVKATPRAARSIRLLGTARTQGDVPTYDPAALERRIACWQRAGHVAPTAAPRIATYPGQKATISMLEQVSYVSDYDVEMTGMASPLIANPIIQTVQEGLSLECAASLAPRGVTLSADLTWAEIKRPIEEFETTLASGGPKVKIQIPEVRIRRVKRDLGLVPGRAALLADLAPVPEGDGRVVLAWIEAETIVEPGLAKIEQKVAEALR